MRAAMDGQFYKMHGLGNDFVVVDARAVPFAMTSARATAIADRHLGIGCDQLIVIASSDDADATMRIWNADGSEVEACGNAARAVGVLIGRATLMTKGGTISVSPEPGGVTVDMGVPRFGWDEVPLAYSMDTAALPLAWGDLAHPAAINMGNPHLVFLRDEIDAVDLATLGPTIEHDPLFPDRINVNVAVIEDRHRIRLRTWERGAGLTRACGTGACATAVAAIRAGRVDSTVAVRSSGGTLTIEWQPGETVRMMGPATHVFTGQTDWARFPA